MSSRIYTDEEKLEVLEDILDASRGEYIPGLLTDEDLTILKSICSDIRARTPKAANRVLDALAFQIESATRAKARFGYMEVGHMQAVAEGLIAHWSVVKRALEDAAR